MRQGGRRLLRLPPELGLGAGGAQGSIPPNAGLIFLIDRVDLEKRAAQSP
ncbi:MAG: FKBP-type peptidyl-prolyl cis-trans isomerase [Gammaproteobacteria bacterium]